MDPCKCRGRAVHHYIPSRIPREANDLGKESSHAQHLFCSSSYQLAVSSISLDPGEVGSVGLCASARGAKEKDGSLYLAYHLLLPGTQTPGPTETIGWAGTGTVGTSEYTPDRFTVHEKTHTITIKGNPYNSAGTGTATAFSGMPYLQWTGSTIIGNNNTYNMIRYNFPNVPLGAYEVTGPSGGSLLSKNKEGVYLYDRQFSLLSSPPEKGNGSATSQSLRQWEIVTLGFINLPRSSLVSRPLTSGG